MRLLFTGLVWFFAFTPFALGETIPNQLGLDQWVSSHFKDHPSVGKIVTSSGQPVELADLLKDVSNSKVLLLGENHDNPDHHLIQAALIREFAKGSGHSAQAIFEMVPENLQQVLDLASKGSNQDMAQLGFDLKWKERGWYSWDIYRPIFKSALAAGFELKAGSIERSKIRALSKQGKAALSDDEQKRLSLHVPLAQSQAASLKAELKNSHCGLMPDKALPAMALVQAVRDGAMAYPINTSAEKRSVLIAGNGHVRKDRGVPRLLNETKSISIGLIEISSANFDTSPSSFLNEQGDALYDYVIFTPKFDITDHCAAMRKKFAPKIKK